MIHFNIYRDSGTQNQVLVPDLVNLKSIIYTQPIRLPLKLKLNNMKV